MQNPTSQPTEEYAEDAPSYLDQAFESRDHANQWDVSELMFDSKTQVRSAEAE